MTRRTVIRAGRRIATAAYRGQFYCTNALHRVVGTLRGNGVAAYWWCGQKNFGDVLTAALLRSYGFTPVHAAASDAQVVAAGSVLGAIPADYEGVILGAGFIHAGMSRTYRNAHVLALRGELSRVRAGVSKGTLLADPGLLSPRLASQPVDHRFVLGIVPHLYDRGDHRIRALQRTYRDQVTVIDVSTEPARVARRITQCQHVLSSSLHGVIVADGMGVPNAWVQLSDRVLGDGFKFVDYATGVSRRLQPQEINGTETLRQLVDMTALAPPDVVAEKQAGLDAAFSALRSHLVT